MIYLAILLILCGVLILITALSIETGKLNAGGVSVRHRGDGERSSRPSDIDEDDIELVVPDNRDYEKHDRVRYDMFESPEYENAEPELFDDEPVIDVLDQDIDIPQQEKRELHGSAITGDYKRDYYDEPADVFEENEIVPLDVYDGDVYAVMFDDRSNIIDYESGTGVIDPTFAKYKSIKRIGRGTIESDFDGVSFNLQGQLYRFDFHKVYDIWSGPNYVALPLKGNSTVKLFIIENSEEFPDKVETDYKEYEKGL